MRRQRCVDRGEHRKVQGQIRLKNKWTFAFIKNTGSMPNEE